MIMVQDIGYRSPLTLSATIRWPSGKCVRGWELYNLSNKRVKGKRVKTVTNCLWSRNVPTAAERWQYYTQTLFHKQTTAMFYSEATSTQEVSYSGVVTRHHRKWIIFDDFKHSLLKSQQMMGGLLSNTSICELRENGLKQRKYPASSEKILHRGEETSDNQSLQPKSAEEYLCTLQPIG